MKRSVLNDLSKKKKVSIHIPHLVVRLLLTLKVCKTYFSLVVIDLKWLVINLEYSQILYACREKRFKDILIA